MTILIKLILYISYIALIVFPLNSLPTLLKMIARGFFVVFYIHI
jgi:hypothetical protein